MAARFARVLEAEPATPSLIRRAFRDWLGKLRWPADETTDLVLALDEAVANVVDHAYLHAAADQYRQVRVHAEQLTSPRGRWIRIQVTDTGRWRPALRDPGYRGRGLSMMRTCSESVRINPTPTGTQVTITSRPISAPQLMSAHRNHIPGRPETPAIERRPRPPAPAPTTTSNAREDWPFSPRFASSPPARRHPVRTSEDRKPLPRDHGPGPCR